MDIVSEERIKIRYSDVDIGRSLKPFSLLNFFQDLASDNAEKLGFGFSSIYPQNLMWVLLRYRVEFINYPTDIQEIILRTYPRGYKKFFAYRNFEIFAQGSVLANVSSQWSLVDFSKGALSNIENILASNPYMNKFVPDKRDLPFVKIPKLSRIDYEKEFEVRYNDIDINRHANNSNYMIWALEPLGDEFLVLGKLKNIDIEFKKEIKYGERLISQVELIGADKTLHLMKSSETSEELCRVLCEWR